jgi:hypothetical protein
MALKQGEVYKCLDPNCGYEITVTKGVAPGKGDDLAPRCCSKEMEERKNIADGAEMLYPRWSM